MPSIRRSKQERALIRAVWTYYRAHGRETLPWRRTRSPYRILISEVMLQQTQVTRVVPKYRAFIRAFPTVEALAHAPLRDVLTLWQGLGYNRRAKALHDAARTICTRYHGRIPRTEAGLVALPGIGTYTARAMCAFAYRTPVALIETNIRTVLLHALFGARRSVPDSELIIIAERLLDTKKPREWNWALMDYGAHLKTRGVRNNSVSAHYVKQSRFKGSAREVRGALIRHLTARGHATMRSLTDALPFSSARITTQLNALTRDGLVRRRGRVWMV